MNKNQLIEAAKDLSNIVDFDIDVKKLDQYRDNTIRAEIIEAAVVLEDGDKIKQSTADVLEELEVDVPAGIKIIQGAKTGKTKDKPKEEKPKTSKKTSKKSSDKKPQSKKPGSKKEAQKPKKAVERNNDLKDKLVSLLKEKSHTQKEIKEMLLDEFPDKSPSTISTLLSDVKNEKWCPLDKLAIVDSKGIMRFQ